jgi:hypothetical protein
MLNVSVAVKLRASGPKASYHSAAAMRFQCVRRPWFVLDGRRLASSGLRAKKPRIHFSPATKLVVSMPSRRAMSTTMVGSLGIGTGHACSMQRLRPAASSASISCGNTSCGPRCASGATAPVTRRCAAMVLRPYFFASLRRDSLFVRFPNSSRSRSLRAVTSCRRATLFGGVGRGVLAAARRNDARARVRARARARRRDQAGPNAQLRRPLLHDVHHHPGGREANCTVMGVYRNRTRDKPPTPDAS